MSKQTDIDTDAKPASAKQLAGARRVKDWPLSRRIRDKLRLTQVEFAESFGIPIGTVRDWDQGRVVPDAAAQSLLNTIAVFPDAVAAAQMSGFRSRKKVEAEIAAVNKLIAKMNEKIS